MNFVRISGREYRERPPSRPVSGGRGRRLRLIVESLRFASDCCSEGERRLYKSILEVLAHAENLRDQDATGRNVQAQLSDLRKHELEP